MAEVQLSLISDCANLKNFKKGEAAVDYQAVM